ncbi:hypothetical protein [Lentzea sp. NPDC003310]|uniref:hypothetical protein n=1 Tax=Lentzea sp. NPDC003310 TaxID=3154447 RepID=UPI0033A5B53C
MVELPPPLAHLAAERGLGPCTRRLRLPLTASTALGVGAFTGLALLLLALSAAPFVLLALPVLVAGLLLHRRRGAAVYLFDAGVVVASGWTAPQVVPWDRVEGRLAETVRDALNR